MNITVAGLTVTRQAQTVLKGIESRPAIRADYRPVRAKRLGKSTLLRCLAGLFPRLGERVALNGTTLGMMPLKNARSTWRLSRNMLRSTEN
ncbi:hypothetical protein ACVXG7_01870 [Enterobacter hormaechei]